MGADAAVIYFAKSAVVAGNVEPNAVAAAYADNVCVVCAVADAVDAVYVDAACVAVTVCAGAGVCRYYGCFLLLMFMMYCKCLG